MSTSGLRGGQMYLRDPAYNIVRINWPNVATLDRLVVEDIEKVPIEADEGARTMLYIRYHEVLLRGDCRGVIHGERISGEPI